MTDQPASPEIDELDKAIIRHLQVDGRMPYSKLGPAVGWAQAAARQRVQRLVDRGVMQVVAVTDPAMLGFAVQALVGVEVSGDVRAAARGTQNLLPVMRTALQRHATLGEVSDALRDVFGVYHPGR